MGTTDTKEDTVIPTTTESLGETMVPGPVPPPAILKPTAGQYRHMVPFTAGELLPLKGIVFVVEGVTSEGKVVLVPREFTKGFIKRMGR